MESKSYAALPSETLAALDPNASYARIREMVGSGKRVLDVGCGPGNLAKVLRQAGNRVVGIDIDESGLMTAETVCERTIKADLDRAELDEIVGDDRFDVVVFADILEHLRNPVRLLTSSRRVLREGGFAILSIPNVAHGAVRLALLRGRFEYQQLGILDDSHLRFYTRESVLRLLSDSGFIGVRVERTTAAVFESSDLVPFVRREDFDPAVVAEIMRDEDADTLQFVVRAAPLADVAALEILTAEITSLQQTVRTLRAQLAQTREAAASQRFEGRAVRATGSNGSRALTQRLEEVEQHYRNALSLTEATRAERDAALEAAEQTRTELAGLRADLARREAELAAISRAPGELEGVRAELAAAQAELETLRARLEQREAEFSAVEDQRRVELARLQEQLDERERELAAAAGQARAEIELVRAELAARDAAVEELRASHAAALAAVEPLRTELFRVQALADARAAEREAALARGEVAAEELAGVAAAAETAEGNLRAVRALLAQVERERDAAAEAAAQSERAVRDELANVAPTVTALQRRASSLERLLAVERTSREDVENAFERIAAVARRRSAEARDAEHSRMRARSTALEAELRTALLRVPRVRPPELPRLVGLRWSADALRAACVARRTATLVTPDPRRERMRARWQRLRRLFAG